MSIFNFFKKKEIEKASSESNVLNQSKLSKNEDEDEIAAVISAVLASMDDEETVAAIMAAITCVLGKSTSDFVVRNIKRTPELDSIWAQAGRMKLMR